MTSSREGEEGKADAEGKRKRQGKKRKQHSNIISKITTATTTKWAAISHLTGKGRGGGKEWTGVIKITR